MKTYTKNIIISLLVSFSVFSFAFAADTYLFSVDGKEYGDPSTGFTAGYSTKEKCESERSAGAGHVLSPECYKASPVTIKSLSTTEAPIGGMVTISGTNLIGITGATIGSTQAEFYTDSPTSARIKVGAGTTSGKVTIKTEYRGQATSSQTLKITDTASSRWWFTNVQKQIMGPDGGYTTLAECESAHDAYNKGNGVTTGDKSCASGTLADWQKAKAAEKPLGSTEEPPVTIKPKSGAVALSDDYKLLAPIGTLTTFNTKNIGDYFNMIFMLAIGLCAALAVFMIIINAIQYMGTESIFGKTEAKSKIFGAILGLLIALGSYAILNTISPDLTGVNGLTVDQAKITVIDLPDAGDDTVDPGFVKNDWKYSTDATISPEVTTVISKIAQGWEIDHFTVYTNERMLISLKKGTEYDNSNVIDVRSGVNGFSEVGQGHSKDNKTPKGTWKILQIRTSDGGKKPVYSGKGSNMGATFWLLSPTTNGDRGIGMHGNKNGTLSRTNGCVRLKNSDLLALLPYVRVGIPVNIN